MFFFSFLFFSFIFSLYFVVVRMGAVRPPKNRGWLGRVPVTSRKRGTRAFSFSPRARQRVPLRKPTPLDELICTCTCTCTVGSDQTRGRDVIQPRAVVPSAARPAGCAGHRTPPTAPRAGGPGGPHTHTGDRTGRTKATPHRRARRRLDRARARGRAGGASPSRRLRRAAQVGGGKEPRACPMWAGGETDEPKRVENKGSWGLGFSVHSVLKRLEPRAVRLPLSLLYPIR